MEHWFTGLEGKIFCLLIIGCLYGFRLRSFPVLSTQDKRMYGCTAAAILFSVLGGFVSNGAAAVLCFAMCGSASLVALYYGFRPSRIGRKLLCVLLGVLSFYLAKKGINAAAYLLVFVAVAGFVKQQDYQIKIDNLTKLYNRYGMDVELREQLRQYEQEHSDSFYLIACDLDNFKHINDTWGHLEGDRALILVASALSSVAKRFDSEVFRIGGDEFVIITDKSDEGLAEAVTDAVRNELDLIEFRDDFDIRMSIGYALYDGVTSIDDLLNSADKKLYEAKKRK